MASIRLTQFAGLMPELSAKLKRKDNAQIAHNCLLYDGKLRAMPAYFKYNTLSNTPTSLYRSMTGLGGTINGRVEWDFDIRHGVYVDGAPFACGVLGLATRYFRSFIAYRPGTNSVSAPLTSAGIPAPNILSANVTNIAAGHQTTRPTVVSYAVTFYRTVYNAMYDSQTVQESGPRYLGTVGDAYSSTLYYEGDAVQITASLGPLLSSEVGYRLYRTITALESGEQMVNTFDTDWYLVTDQLFNGATSITYVDNALTESIQGDLLLTKKFQAPYYTLPPSNFGITESGWCWATTENEILFSDRFLSHTWPISNYNVIPRADTIINAVTFYDDVYLGTAGRPYKVSIQTSADDHANISILPYPEMQACLPDTMVAAPFGALYTSLNGIVSLSDRMQVVSRELLNGGSILYHDCDTKFKFQDITKAAWFNGWYIGYAPSGKIFIYDVPEDLNDSHPFQQLVTMDAPVQGVPNVWATGDYGLHTAFGTDLYYWPVPGWERDGDTVSKLCYTWKSKKFVFPGTTTFAAAKVVWDCDGEVCIKIIGDCRHVFQRKITNCNPFRLPHNYRHIEWEIELTGTGSVSEVHLATSMQELTEVENG